MVSKAKELVKGIVKNAAPKSTYATDPNDPWSAKAGIAENVTSRRADLLKKFYKAKGYNIDYVSKNQRVGQAKTGEFEKWKSDHGIYEDNIGEDITYKPADGKPRPTSAGHTLVGYSFHSNGTKHANILKHGETGKYFAAGGSSSHPVKSTTYHDSPEEAAKSKKSYVKEQGLAEGSPIVVMPSPERLKKAEPTKVRYQGDIVPPTQPLSTEKRGVKGRPGQRPMPQQGVAEANLSELNKDTVYSYAKKAEKDQDKQFNTISKGMRDNDPKSANKASHKFSMRSVGINRAEKRLTEEGVAEETAPIAVKQIRSHTSDSPTHKRMHQLNKAAQLGTIKSVQPPTSSGLRKEDNINDPQCATQSPFDGANTTNDVAPKKSKAIKMVKEIYAKHRLKEDLYDHEKDDKGPGTFGKSPKVSKKIEVNDDNEKGTNARMVLKGGTTLTGEKRDTIEIDPMLKNRSKTADYLDQDAKKEQLRTK